MKPPWNVFSTRYRAVNGGGAADGAVVVRDGAGTAGAVGAALVGAGVADAALVGLGGSVRRGESPGTAGDGRAEAADASRPVDEARSGRGAATAGGPGGTGLKSGPGPRYVPTATTKSATIMATPTDNRIQGEDVTAAGPWGGT
ncbi:hypothetical protein ACQPYA_22145 [Micromonospora sp. CA-263727]|uniref:hypothetical protein n=1 Tax=Micromonospora sp. CA-263727 TaxID=3239967 RepID=UPI003D923060